MPQWLCNQLMRAFQNKNRRQIRLLNDSWFFYRTRRSQEELSDSPTPEGSGKRKY
ncbi:cortex morphogenetic protein CmpA [Paenibacillus hexagrammi]|uniref:Cortex morphogenetic protein CmpA n=1 Tax=Paenibacillus hexagrammi TaxID=2908839 RepID=A0ABY3SKB4_9BACL|nr:cortex morphogenetic protein CmpA [Paenibacillus sp. YPD9-1]UJF34278.1 cortex morphogenetic protein CmpA [Paenibacillus sp. YPD9-1]